MLSGICLEWLRKSTKILRSTLWVSASFGCRQFFPSLVLAAGEVKQHCIGDHLDGWPLRNTSCRLFLCSFCGRKRAASQISLSTNLIGSDRLQSRLSSPQSVAPVTYICTNVQPLYSLSSWRWKQYYYRNVGYTDHIHTVQRSKRRININGVQQ
jgi:hypothetical protein